MSFCDWLSHPPIGVGVAAAILLAIAGASENYKQRAACEDGRASHQCEPTNSNVVQIGGPPVYRIQPPPADPNPDRDEWRTENDLQAQWEQAKWAFWAVVAAFTAIGVTGIGVVFVALTLQATRAAVDEAGRATKAANEAVEVTRNTAERQLRAYISVEPHYEIHPNTVPDYRIKVINRGQTPAYEVLGWSDGAISIGPEDEELDEYPTTRKANAINRTLGPGADFYLNASFTKPISNDEIKEMLAGRWWMFVWGEVTYRDAFMQQRYLRFRYRVGGHGMRVGRGFTICKGGNEEN